MAELKPCPFCGGEAEEKYLRRKMRYRLFNFPNITHYVYIKCKICGATTAVKETRENASDVWNKRTKPERPKGRWIYYYTDGIKRCKCPECLTSYGCFDTPFCPNCGVDMRGESE